MKTAVSVIIPVFNQESTVERAVNSVLAQDFSLPYEIIICDDASSDNTQNLCKKIADKHPDKIRLILRNENVGIQKNYFEALRLAKGEFIADCAGDDFWIGENRLSILYNIINQDKTIGLIHSDWLKFNPSDNSLHQRIIPPYALKYYSDEIAPEELLIAILSHKVNPLIHLSTALYRRNIITPPLDKYPDLFLNPEYGCEDLQIAAFIAKSHRVAYCPEKTLAYSIGESTISNNHNFNKQLKFHSGSIKLVSRLCDVLNVDKNKISQFFYERCNYLASITFATGNPKNVTIVKNITNSLHMHLSLKSRIKLLILQNKTLMKIVSKLRHH